MLKAGLDEEQIVEKMALNPRKIVGLEVPKLEKGEKANLVVFDTKEKWVFDETTNKSKSKNNPLFGTELVGKVKLIVNNNQLIENN
ncbi:amidohydrolase family protein [Sphingobacterium sp. T2]|uniref:amidohydrolase family protein n=1 Tax=Sphingobacterium sp. T2 TaxID=1590596 RepID=UPI00293513BE|nr:amidohydrolase family protein [Sphingobacterium sp. T2]